MALFDSKPGPEGHPSPVASVNHDADYSNMDPNAGVKRGLKTRHLSMMALAGIIGPGVCLTPEQILKGNLTNYSF